MSAEVDPEDALVTVVPKAALTEALRKRKERLGRYADTIPEDMERFGYEALAQEKRAELLVQSGDLARCIEKLEAVEAEAILVHVGSLLQQIDPIILRNGVEEIDRPPSLR